jgi:signal transduction histidine kinase
LVQDRADVTKLLRIGIMLLLAYLGLSAIIDYTLKSPGSVQEYFYFTSAAIALFFLGISSWSWLHQKLGKSFLALLILLICALPAAFNQVAIHYFFPNIQGTPEALFSRVVPFFLIALILVAWQYRWQHVVIFCVSMALLNTVILAAFVANNADLSNGLFAILTQVMSFVVVGLFISVLVGRMKQRRKELEEANARLVHYSQTLEDLAVSRERSRLAQELHDTLSHTLSGLSVQLEAMKAYWDVDTDVARAILDKSLNATRSGLEETRRALVALRAKPLEEFGLQASLKQAAQELAEHHGLTLEIKIAEVLPTLTPEAEQCLFRVAQEALLNVAKHARANRLMVTLEAVENRTILTVRDDGLGFEVKQSNGQGHFGLLGMKERVKCIGATLDISSQPGRGTKIQLTI